VGKIPTSASAKKLPPDAKPKRIQHPIAESFRSPGWEACIIGNASPQSRCYFVQDTLPKICQQERICDVPNHRRERRWAVALTTEDGFRRPPDTWDATFGWLWARKGITFNNRRSGELEKCEFRSYSAIHQRA